MNDYNASRFFISWIITLFVSGVVGIIYGEYLGERDGTITTTISCVEKPKECKVKYDFYQLEKQK